MENTKAMKKCIKQIRETFNTFLKETNTEYTHDATLFPLISVIIEYCAEYDVSPTDIFKYIVYAWSVCPDAKIQQKLEPHLAELIKSVSYSIDN